MFESVDARTDTRTPARVPSYKLTLRALGSGELKISMKSDFIPFFHDFIHVYSPRAGAYSPQGTKV